LFRFGGNMRQHVAMRAILPKSVAQLTGVLVTGIVAFGTDLDVYYAIPLGVFAGALAIFFVSISEAQDAHAMRWRSPEKPRNLPVKFVK
jgi:hypothetical protein